MPQLTTVPTKNAHKIAEAVFRLGDYQKKSLSLTVFLLVIVNVRAGVLGPTGRWRTSFHDTTVT